MIKRELYFTRKDNVNIIKTYSDNNYYILQVETGNEYDYALDIENAPYTYVETTKPIVVESEVSQDEIN